MKFFAKQFLLVNTIVCALTGTVSTATNKTFFMPRPINGNLPLFMAHELKQQQHRIVITPFYQQSTNKNDMGKYFTFENKQSLTIKPFNFASPYVKIGDIHPFNFNLTSGYDGQISFHPTQMVYGLHAGGYHSLNTLIRNLYASWKAPIIVMRNNPGLCEIININGTQATHSGPMTIADTMRGDLLTTDWTQSWQYWKVNGTKQAQGLADIDLRIGYRDYDAKDNSIGIYGALTIPTGNKPTAEYLFEPILGNGGHLGLGAGLDATYRLWHSNTLQEKTLSVFAAANYNYLFAATQPRTLGLKGKNWGHVIRMCKEDTRNPGSTLGGSQPGVNIMTRRVSVLPGNHLDLSTGLTYATKSKWNIDLGYNIWLRQSEKVSLKNQWESAGRFGLISFPDNYVEEGMQTTDGKMLPKVMGPGSVTNEISSETTIGINHVGNGKFITAQDIDLKEQPSSLSHKIFLQFAHHISIKKREFSLGAIGSYEHAQKNTALSQWLVGLTLATGW